MYSLFSEISRVLFGNKDAIMTSDELKEALDSMKQGEEKSPFDEKDALSVNQNGPHESCPQYNCKNYKAGDDSTKRKSGNEFDKYLIKGDKKRRKHIPLWVISLFIPFLVLILVSLFSDSDDKRERVVKRSDSHREVCSHCCQNIDESFCYVVPCCKSCEPCAGCTFCDKRNERLMSNQNHRNSHEFDCSSTYKEKDRSIIDLFTGLVAIVLTIVLAVAMIFYFRYLKKVVEKEFEIDNSILEYNKRVKMEHFRLDTARKALYNHYLEQKLEMDKREKMIRQDEIQQYLDHLRKCDMKEYELKNAYLNKIAEVTNKWLDIQRVDKKEKTIKIDTNAKADAKVTYEKK